uniref:BRWD/PHIP N-terminal domain-containing protein n=1 Tax=Chrysotila carterae TaxID=13221 RepID=A0A7S4BJ08_CHRCT
MADDGEVFFLIMRFLQHSSCRRAAAALRTEAADRLPRATMADGSMHTLTFEEMVTQHPCPGDQLTRILTTYIEGLGEAAPRSLLAQPEAPGRTLSLKGPNSLPISRWLAVRGLRGPGRFKAAQRKPMSVESETAMLLSPARFGLRGVVEGHINSAYCLTFDSVGDQIFTGADDGLVKVWSSRHCLLLHTLVGHKAEISDLSVHPNGRWLASASHDNSVMVWALHRDGVPCVARLELDSNSPIVATSWRPPTCVSAPTQLLAVSNNGSVVIWSMPRDLDDDGGGDVGGAHESHARRSGSAALCGSDAHAAEAPTANVGMVGATPTHSALGASALGQVQISVQGYMHAPAAQTQSVGQGAGVEGASAHGWLRGVTAMPIKESANFEAFCGAWSPGGTRFAVGTTDCVVYLFRGARPAQHTPTPRAGDTSPVLVCTLRGHKHDVTSVAWSHAGDALVSGSKDGSARLWRFKNAVPRAGRTLAAEATFPTERWSSQLLGSLPVDGAAVPVIGAVAWSCDDTLVLTSTSDAAIQVWCGKSGVWLRNLSAGLGRGVAGGEVYVLESHPTLPHVALSASYDGTATLWDARAGAKLSEMKLPRFDDDTQVVEGRWAPDGQSLSLTDIGGRLTVFGVGLGAASAAQQTEALASGHASASGATPLAARVGPFLAPMQQFFAHDLAHFASEQAAATTLEPFAEAEPITAETLVNRQQVPYPPAVQCAARQTAKTAMSLPSEAALVATAAATAAAATYEEELCKQLVDTSARARVSKPSASSRAAASTQPRLACEREARLQVVDTAAAEAEAARLVALEALEEEQDAEYVPRSARADDGQASDDHDAANGEDEEDDGEGEEYGSSEESGEEAQRLTTELVQLSGRGLRRSARHSARHGAVQDETQIGPRRLRSQAGRVVGGAAGESRLVPRDPVRLPLVEGGASNGSVGVAPAGRRPRRIACVEDDLGQDENHDGQAAQCTLLATDNPEGDAGQVPIEAEHANGGGQQRRAAREQAQQRIQHWNQYFASDEEGAAQGADGAERSKRRKSKGGPKKRARAETQAGEMSECESSDGAHAPFDEADEEKPRSTRRQSLRRASSGKRRSAGTASAAKRANTRASAQASASGGATRRSGRRSQAPSSSSGFYVSDPMLAWLVPEMRVELQMMEENMQGRWYTALVLGFEQRGEQDTWIEVKYDEILDVDNTQLIEKRCYEHIRPLPPATPPGFEATLMAGLRVDFYYDDAWWPAFVEQLEGHNMFSISLEDFNCTKHCSSAELRPQWEFDPYHPAQWTQIG